jgi:hypothetical protein
MKSEIWFYFNVDPGRLVCLDKFGEESHEKEIDKWFFV